MHKLKLKKTEKKAPLSARLSKIKSDFFLFFDFKGLDKHALVVGRDIVNNPAVIKHRDAGDDVCDDVSRVALIEVRGFERRAEESGEVHNRRNVDKRHKRQNTEHPEQPFFAADRNVHKQKNKTYCKRRFVHIKAEHRHRRKEESRDKHKFRPVEVFEIKRHRVNDKNHAEYDIEPERRVVDRRPVKPEQGVKVERVGHANLLVEHIKVIILKDIYDMSRFEH